MAGRKRATHGELLGDAVSLAMMLRPELERAWQAAPLNSLERYYRARLLFKTEEFLFNATGLEDFADSAIRDREGR